MESSARLSFSPEVSTIVEDFHRGFKATGLSFEITKTYKKPPAVETFSFSKFWLSNHRGKAKTITTELKGTREEITIDMSKFNNKYLSCIAEHIDDYPDNYIAVFGEQMVLTDVFMPTTYEQDYPRIITTACNGNMDLMKFNLLLMSLLHGKTFTDAQVQDSTDTTAYAALMFMAVRQIDGYGGYAGNSLMMPQSGQPSWPSLSPGMRNSILRIPLSRAPGSFLWLWEPRTSRLLQRGNLLWKPQLDLVKSAADW